MSRREILFKAKRTDNGEWVEGYYVEKVDPLLGIRKSFILNQVELSSLCHWYQVDPQTVCQYTGLDDKNGRKIFDGDRVALDKGEEYEKNGFVSYSNGVFVIQFEKTWDFLCANLEYAEIIGNIHEN